jgi:hypothetical protein
MTDYKFIYVDNARVEGILIRAKRNDAILGRITLYHNWKCHIFEPEDGTIFSWDCLKDLSNILLEFDREDKKQRSGL